MPIQERKDLIRGLEKSLDDARVLAVVTGDRQGMETRVAPDILPLVSEHLAAIGPVDQLALFLYTPGGDTIAGWGLVNLLRQYCNRLKVLVPFRVLSCGTLIALGADEILMSRHGLLSPIDPSVGSPFNPLAPGPDATGRVPLLPVSVEDLSGFLDLARNEIGLKSEASMIELLKILAEKVHPLALGAVYRAKEQNSSLAKRLIMRHSEDEAKAERIVKKLTQELPTHNYLIGRREATEDIGLKIIAPSENVDLAMWKLYKEYEHWLQLTSPTSPELDLGGQDRKRVVYERAAIESLRNGTIAQHIFVTDKELIKIQTTPPGMQMPLDQIIERVIYQGWKSSTDGMESA